MPTETWSAFTNRSTLLSTELNSLADGSYSAAGSALDNGANKDRFAMAQLDVTFASNPTVDTTCDLFAVPAPDGTNYGDGGGSVKPSAAYYCGSFPLRAVTTAQKIMTQLFELPPCKVKFVLLNNGTGRAFPGSGSTVTIYTCNRTIS